MMSFLKPVINTKYQCIPTQDYLSFHYPLLVEEKSIQAFIHMFLCKQL